METDKFEKHIKTKLNERKIKPSADTWNKISEGLAVQAPSKKPNYSWIGIAASILVLIGTGLFYLNTSSEEKNNDVEVVVTPIEKVLKEVTTEKRNNDLEIAPTSIVLKEQVEENKFKEIPVAHKQEVFEEEKYATSSDAIASGTPLEALNDNAKTIVLPEDLLNSKIAEVIAQVDAMELSSTVTDAEVDSLLRYAQKELMMNKVFLEDNKVDPMALLSDVEDELDQSFRDKIFERLRTGFVKVRTGVATNDN